MQKILVLRGGALGDFIVTLPALALLRQRWPASRIELAGNPTAARLALAPPKNRGAAPEECHLIDDIVIPPLRGDSGKCHPLDDTLSGRNEGGICPLLDAVHSQHEARWSGLYGSGALPVEFVRWLAEFDLVVNYWPDPSGELGRRFPIRPGQTFLSAPAHPTIAPAAAHYCAPLHALGLATPNTFFPLTVGQGKGKTRAHRRIAIHPGSGSPRKNWPRERWSGLAGWLGENFSAELLFVFGEAELEAGADANAGESFARHGRVLRNLPLRALAAELAECRLFLGHDSGVSHLAAACGVPCVLLFGPTDPAMWAPPAPQVRVIHCGPELAAISLSDVQDAVTASLANRG